MGTYYKFRCKTCDEYQETEMKNGDHTLTEIWQQRYLLRHIYNLFDDGNIFSHHFMGSAAQFAASHCDHELEIINDNAAPDVPLSQRSFW